MSQYECTIIVNSPYMYLSIIVQALNNDRAKMAADNQAKMLYGNTARCINAHLIEGT